MASSNPEATVSYVQLSIPNQSVCGQSVIQQSSTQQSVIQAPSASATVLQSLPKNVILLNKPMGSVIHSTEDAEVVQHLQLISTTRGSEGNIITLSLASLDENSKKRRELLTRRPSYRKILHDLSTTDLHGAVEVLTSAEDIKGGTVIINGNEKNLNEHSFDSGSTTVTIGGAQYQTAGIQLKGISPEELQSFQDGQHRFQPTVLYLDKADSFSDRELPVVQSVTNGKGEIFACTRTGEMEYSYDLRSESEESNSTGIIYPTADSGNISSVTGEEEASRKKLVRLLKNREAAKECRRKKKEYIKCLENRVAVLENQNKALIEELKSLKELYCRK